MGKLVTHNANALRFLMNDDLYDLGDIIQSDKPAEIREEEKNEPLAGPASIVKEELEPVSFNYLGDNNRYFLIIVNDKTHADLNTPHKEMVMKIMVAKKLEMRDLAIFNLAKYPDVTFVKLKEFFNCNKVVLFGIDPLTIGLPVMAANQADKHLEVKILATFGLEEMISNTDKKREFWNVMKDF